ncbi:MAG: hypothetical protein IJR89_04260 [Clostridia bacterium]|nr:hypothetical protein [Clostridia bacterium]
MSNESTMSYKCPSCDARLRFDETTGRLQCDYCGGSFGIDEVAAYNAAQSGETPRPDAARETPSGEEEENAELGVLTCPTCGGELVFDKDTAASACPYCGNPAMVKSRLTGKFKPELIIPFSIPREKAKEALKKFAGKRILLPRGFLSESKLESIRGIYLPFWLYRCTADASAVFSAQKTFTTRGSNYDTVRTDYYEIDRDASMDFENVAVDGSSRMADSLMDAISPYSYSDARAFSTAYLSGFFADRYDEDADQCAERAKNRIENTALSVLRQSVSGYENVSVKSSAVAERDLRSRYALLPVWLLVNRYKGEAYTYAMNGQTGKFVGELPVSKKRFWLFTLLLTVGIGALIAAGYFFWMGGGV